MKGCDSRIKESGAVGIRELMFFHVRGSVDWIRTAAKGNKRDTGANNGDHGKGDR
jgi:hypothetical protein